ncbi:NrdH-redoxin [Massilia sp. YMA4]|nr:NrdH-redoxin [Massilia sp. YMA4]
MLKQWLTREGVAFAERDISDPDIMAEAKARTGVRVAPISIVEGAVFYGPFHSQQSRLRRSACLQPPERES